MPSKSDILSKLRAAHPALAHDVAKAHGGVLYDLSCKTPKCGQKVSHFFVELPTNARALALWSMDAEIRIHACPKCGARGFWAYKESAPASGEQVADAQAKAAAAELAAKQRRAEEIDAQVKALQAEREKLDLEPVEAVEVAEAEEQEPVEEAPAAAEAPGA